VTQERAIGTGASYVAETHIQNLNEALGRIQDRARASELEKKKNRV